MSTAGSLVLVLVTVPTLEFMEANIRAPAHAPRSPRNVPTATRALPCFMTSAMTAGRLAPRATRIPISWVRCTTEYAVTPANPTPASTTPNSPTRAYVPVGYTCGVEIVFSNDLLNRVNDCLTSAIDG